MMYRRIEGVKMVIIRVSFGVPGPDKNLSVGICLSWVDAVPKNSSFYLHVRK